MFFDRRGKFIELADIPLSKRTVVVDSGKVNASNNYHLSLDENVVEVDSSDIGATCDIFLPDVAKAAGIAFDIFSPDCGDGSTVQVYEADESTQVGNDFDTNDDYVTVISTGKHWRVLDNSSA